MKKSTFYKLLFLLIAIGIAVTVSLVIYTAYEYMNSSIITYIAREMCL